MNDRVIAWTVLIAWLLTATSVVSYAAGQALAIPSRFDGYIWTRHDSLLSALMRARSGDYITGGPGQRAKCEGIVVRRDLEYVTFSYLTVAPYDCDPAWLAKHP